jgi:hypothetical protein
VRIVRRLQSGVDRVKMFECMRERERGISEWLVRKVEEIYGRTRNKVKVGEKEGEWFETTKGVRQGCPLEVKYGAEIWGWKEQEEVERVQEKYLK